MDGTTTGRTPVPTVYVALGDSISIDEYAGGRGRGGASLLAHNRDDDFPEWRGRDLASRGDTRVVVGTVYDPSDGTGDPTRLGLPPWPDGVHVLAELNAALTGVAADHAALVADIHRRFLGHGVLAGDPSQPGARPAERSLWYCNLIEPNAWGASAVRAAFWEALHRTA